MQCSRVNQLEFSTNTVKLDIRWIVTYIMETLPLIWSEIKENIWRISSIPLPCIKVEACLPYLQLCDAWMSTWQTTLYVILNIDWTCIVAAESTQTPHVVLPLRNACEAIHLVGHPHLMVEWTGHNYSSFSTGNQHMRPHRSPSRQMKYDPSHSYHHIIVWDEWGENHDLEMR